MKVPAPSVQMREYQHGLIQNLQIMQSHPTIQADGTLSKQVKTCIALVDKMIGEIEPLFDQIREYADKVEELTLNENTRK